MIVLLVLLLLFQLANLFFLIAIANYIARMPNLPVREEKKEDTGLMEVPSPYFRPSPQKLDKGF